MLEIVLAGTPLVLLSSGAAYLPEHRTLLVADAHFGKAVSFRKLGVPVPQGTTTETLGQLKECTMDGAQKDGSINPELPPELVLYSLYARACDPVPGFLKASGKHSDEAIIDLVLGTCFEGLNAR